MSNGSEKKTPESKTYEWTTARKPHSSTWNVDSPQFCLSTGDKFHISLQFQGPLSYDFLYTIYLGLHFTEKCSSVIQDGPIHVMIRLDSSKSFSPLKISADAKNFKSEHMQIFNPSMASSGTMTINVTISHRIFNQGRTQKLIEDLSQLLMNETLADFTVKAENQDFRVHRCLLSSRSPVLSRMLQSDMKEKNRNEISFECKDPVVLKELFSFIYTGDCVIAKAPHELFRIAHFLQINELCHLCNMFLIQNITLKNIIDTLVLSDEDQFQLDDLRDAAKKFVEQNEKALVQDVEFENYLKLTIRTSNIAFILRIANDHNLTEVYASVMNVLKQKSAEVLGNTEFKKLLLSNPELSVHLLEDVLTKVQSSDSSDSVEMKK